MEKFLSGYCKALDSSRMVELELENGQVLEVDCSYGSCPFQPGCPIAQGIEELKQA